MRMNPLPPKSLAAWMTFALALLGTAAPATANQPAPAHNAHSEVPSQPPPALPGPQGKAATATATAAGSPAAAAARVPAGNEARRRVFFRYDGVDDNIGRLAVTSVDHPDQFQFAGNLRCIVAYATAQSGICMGVEQAILGIYSATLFDPATFKPLGKISVQGLPSRARMAPGGQLAAFTVFTSGHGYGSANFSTRTALIDVSRAAIIAELESFAVSKDGKPFKNKDFNFWGVSFTPDARTFYATLSSEGQYYLIHGDPSALTATVVHSNVECPSISPDGRRIAYKKRLATPGMTVWELHSLDLASGRETSLAERRSVDDQLEWLDNDTVLYTVAAVPDGASPSTNVWRTAADGTGSPRLYLRNASAPSVVR